MRKTIYTIIFITLFINLSFAQGAIIWLNGSKTDSSIIKQKLQFEAKGLKVFVNDSDERAKRHLIKQIDSGDEKFDRIFREGRELIDKEEWAKAAAKFNEIVCDCPEKKQVDAALYWLAFCYNKQKMVKEARATVERLLKNFPDSSWANDARVLSYQIGLNRFTESRTLTGQNIYSTEAGLAYSPAQGTTEIVAGNFLFGQQTQLDREDEIKLAAFQSLMAADPKKGIEAVGNILRTDSKASETLKLQILRTLRGSRYWISRSIGSYSGTYEVTPTTAVTQLNPLLRETLAKSYQNESASKIRAEIIYSIAGINDEQSINYLAQLYSSESNKELKMTIINSFGINSYTVMGNAYFPFSTAEKMEVESSLLSTASANITTTASVAPAAQSGSSKPGDQNPIRKLRFDKLMEIFRSEKDLDLKRAAFNNLQGFVGWADKDGMVGMLSQMYDAESDEKFKSSIISSFSRLNKNTQATNKLLDIAKNDKSDKMRLEAIRALRNNNSPEVIKFLEDLIK